MKSVFSKQKAIIGMVHLRPLPGSPLYNKKDMGMDRIVETAILEAQQLERGGVDGVQIENIWDYPYLKAEDIGHETTAAMAAVAVQVKKAVSIPIGVNCHLNGGGQAVAVAVACGARWVRIFEWVNAYISHAGLTEAIGAKIARYRSLLKADDDIKFLCDINVKHGSHFIISDRSIPEQALDAQEEGADALVVTGFKTGAPPSAEKVQEISRSVHIPVFLGSGTTVENVQSLLRHCDGAIVGSYFKQNSDWKQPVCEAYVRAFMEEVEKLRDTI